MSSNIPRRTFVSEMAAAGAAFHIVPRHVLGGSRDRAPSDTLNVACIGVGGMGGSDVRGMSDENIYALCDVDDRRAARSFNEFPRAKRYGDFRVMLERDGSNIDAVTVSTPDHTHTVAAMMALGMGKHVYCQKPLTRTIWEARQLAAAARGSHVSTQMGNQGHSWEGTRQIREWVEAGWIGTVREVHYWTNRPIWPQAIDRPLEAHHVPRHLDWDLWLGPAKWRPYHPAYAPFAWRGWWDFGTGALGDIGCHAMAAVFWALKLANPTSIEAVTSPVNTETAPNWSIVTYQFPARGKQPPVKVVWYDGGKKPPRPKELAAKRDLGKNGNLIIGDKATMMNGRIIPETKMKVNVVLPFCRSTYPPHVAVDLVYRPSQEPGDVDQMDRRLDEQKAFHIDKVALPRKGRHLKRIGLVSGECNRRDPADRIQFD